MRLINHPWMKFLAIISGAASIMFIAAGIISFFNLAPRLTGGVTPPLIIIVYFVWGILYGGMAISICAHKEETPPVEEE